MDLSTIEMERPKAREAFLDYRKAVRERHNAEDEQIMRGYRELARGRQLIQLSDTIVAGGTVERTWRSWDNRTWKATLPALAVMRADAPECWLETGAQRVSFTPERWYRGRKDRLTVRGLDVSVGEADWKAMVPIVPPALRPKAMLSNYHILWEADWTKEVVRPPRDPALLRRIGGDLFAVVAIWDLTDLERAVLAGRAGR